MCLRLAGTGRPDGTLSLNPTNGGRPISTSRPKEPTHRGRRSSDDHAQPLAGGLQRRLGLLMRARFGTDEAQVPFPLGRRAPDLAARAGDSPPPEPAPAAPLLPAAT